MGADFLRRIRWAPAQACTVENYRRIDLDHRKKRLGRSYQRHHQIRPLCLFTFHPRLPIVLEDMSSTVFVPALIEEFYVAFTRFDYAASLEVLPHGWP